jgi:alkylation response protein AidB-like acyl-CoA dehydrogenase
MIDRQSAEQLIDLAGQYARDRIAPRVAAYDQEEHFPQDLLEEMAELGFFGGTVPVEHGGAGLDHVTFASFIEEISKVCHMMGCLLSMPSGLVGASISDFGTDEQKRRWLEPLASGTMFGAAGVTEPGSGSDVAGMQTTYVRDGDEYVISGSKAWISNLDIASFLITFATSDRSLRHRGISAFIIPTDAVGLGLHPYKDKYGFRPICTGEVILDEVRVGADALLGEEGAGFSVAMAAVERGRLGVASRSVGVAQACLDAARSYAAERHAFGKSIAEFQIVQSKITDMEVGVTTARLLVRHAAEALARGERARKLTSMAKMYASDIAYRSATDAFQIHGAYGVSPEFAIGRYLRDSKVLQIVEGSNDLHRALIGEMSLGLRKSN